VKEGDGLGVGIGMEKKSDGQRGEKAERMGREREGTEKGARWGG
jgi:hypothetical protein